MKVRSNKLSQENFGDSLMGTEEILEKSSYKIHPEQQNIYSSLQIKHNIAALLEQESNVKVQNAINDSVALLPVEFLIRHKMFEYVKFKGIEKMFNIFKKLRILKLNEGLTRWIHTCSLLVLQEQQSSALIITRSIRRFIAVKLLKIRRSKKQHEILQQEILRKRELVLIANVVKVQSIWRMFIIQKKFKRNLNIVKRADIKIQKQAKLYLRKKKQGFLLYEVVLIVIKRIKATRLIQRFYRGFLGRVRSNLIRTAIYHVKAQKRYESHASLLRLYFEQHGAALCLQRWAWSMGWPQRVAIRKRNKIKAIIVAVNIRIIQRAVRTFLIYRKLRRLLQRAKQRNFENKRKKCVIKIQSIWRRHRAKIACNIIKEKQNTFKVRFYKLIRKYLNKLALHKIILHAIHQLTLRYPKLFLIDSDINKNNDTSLFISPKATGKFRARYTAISFDNFRIGDEARIKQLQIFTLKIQMAWRRYYARKILKIKRSQKQSKAATLVYHWFLGKQWRRKMQTAIEKIKPMWRSKYKLRKKREKMSSLIQARLRGFLVRKRLKLLKLHKKLTCIKIQRWLRCLKFHRILRQKILIRRKRDEENIIGKILYTHTVHYYRIDEFWRLSKKANASHEIQNLFQSLCTNGLLELSRFLRLTRECPNLLDTSFDVKDVEIIFAKTRRPPEKRLNYQQFLDLLYAVAACKYFRPVKEDIQQLSSRSNFSMYNGNNSISTGNSSSNLTGKGSRASTAAISQVVSQVTALKSFQSNSKLTNPSTPTPSATPSLSAISSNNNTTIKMIIKPKGEDEVTFTYAWLKGRSALVVCFVDQYIAQSKDYRKVVIDLKSDASLPKATAYVLSMIIKIQSFCKLMLKSKEARRLFEKLKAEAHEVLRQKSAILIARVYRGRRARLAVIPLAQQMYIKCVDSESFVPYWFNNRTESSFWTKPKLLREFDCGEAVLMPPENELCTAPCSVEECDRVASIYCDECDAIMCTSCSASAHENSRKQHNVIVLSLCAQCGFQLASRSCRNCGDLYCDCCFAWVHRRGRLRLHTSTWVCDRCDVCEERAAWWGLIDPDHGYKTTVFCRPCFTELFGPDDPLLKENVFRVQYFGPAVQKLRQKMKENDDKRLEELRQKQLQDEATAVRQQKAVQLIQRVFRAHKVRRETRAFRRERQRYLALRRADEKRRNGIPYNILLTLGMAPALKSDTPMEYTLRLFPWYLKKVVTDCVEKDWDKAAALAGWQQKKVNRNVIEGLLAFQALTTAKMNLSRLRGTLDSADRVHTVARQQYREARATALSTAVVRQKKARADKALQNLKEAKNKFTEGEVEVEKARKRWLLFRYGYTGPLLQYVRERRRNGIPLGITGRLVKGSRTLRLKEENLEEFNQKTFSGCYLNINGSKFRLVTGDLYIEAFAEAKADDNDSSSIDHGDDDDGFNFRSTLFSKKPNVVIEDTNNDATENQDEIEVAVDTVGQDVDLPGEVGVRLDRQWPLASCKDVPLYRVSLKPLHNRLAFQASRYILNSTPVQLSLMGMVMTLHSLSNTTSRAADLFDEDSGAAETCNTLTASISRARDTLLLRSNKTIKLHKARSGPRQSMRQQLQFFVDIIRRSIRTVQAHAQHIQNIAAMTPYQKWEQSVQKEPIIAILDMEDGANPQVLGIFYMDSDAPCDVMREYLERNFRDKLNESVGEDFCFLLPGPGGGTALARKMEIRSWANTYAPLKPVPANIIRALNTEDLMMVEGTKRLVTLVRDRSVEREEPSMIPEFPPDEDDIPA